MDPRPLPPHLRGRDFTVRDALPSTGAERLRRRDLEMPTRGVRAPRGTGLTLEVVALVLGCDQYFSHTTAAGLRGLPLPRRLEAAPLHVTTYGDGSVMRRKGVIGHRAGSGPRPFELLGRYRVETSTNAWASCAPMLSLDEVVELADAVVGRKCRATVDDLAEVVASRSGSRAVALLRRALPLVRKGSDSPGETRLRLLIVRAGRPEPELNVKTYDSQGRYLGRPDMRYPQLKVAIEYEGNHHRTDAKTWRQDIQRREIFAAAGWRTLRATADDVGPSARDFLARLDRTLASGPARVQ